MAWSARTGESKCRTALQCLPGHSAILLFRPEAGPISPHHCDNDRCSSEEVSGELVVTRCDGAAPLSPANTRATGLRRLQSVMSQQSSRFGRWSHKLLASLPLTAFRRVVGLTSPKELEQARYRRRLKCAKQRDKLSEY
jgi:hypothetical protein